ncbi:asparaginase [Cellulomonas sp. PhB143]|uniref:asparaginase n=1 Tax=Cellulomonas sp. PhB143 TaxID=2485186 RepID=UPI000F48C118|nr:asparaginase [Cellulomonas sp. PhB143]ROS78855.1 asparaginase [Cellulomonas sp. PhB143]
MTDDVAARAGRLADVVRSGMVESVHLGHLVVLDRDGAVRLAVGDPDVVVWPRSCVKPLQAVAMVRAGLDLPPELLALAAASHNGEAVHLAGARRILGAAGLDESALRNEPDLPLLPAAALAWQVAGHGPDRITQNCSGKHAAMLLTCVGAGWDTATYLDPAHPLQQAVRATISELTGDDPDLPVSTDGCGAPLFATSLRGLARATGRVAAGPARAPGSAQARVASAVSAHPEMVAGTGREGTAVMRALPGVVAKDGVDGMFAVGLPDGASIAFKVLDGSARPRPAVLVAALRRAALDGLGLDAGALDALDGLEHVPVLGGGVPVGEVRAAF